MGMEISDMDGSQMESWVQASSTNITIREHRLLVLNLIDYQKCDVFKFN